MGHKGFIHKASIILSAVLIGIFMATRALAGVASPTGLKGVAPPAEIPASYFGMHISSTRHWPSVSVGALGKGTLVSWIYIETARGTFDWSKLDAWVDFAQSHGVSFFWANGGVPRWATSDQSKCRPSADPNIDKCTAMITDITDWDNFITALVTRYKGKLIYELWNEPDYGASWTGSVADMVTLTSHMYNIVRSLDPGATIIAPSGGATFMASYYAAGRVRTVDVVSVHGYPGEGIHNVAESIGGILTVPMKAVMATYGLRQPIWDTEGSWGNSASGAPTDPDVRAAFIARDFLLHWSNGITRFYWYAWDGVIFGELWTVANGPNLAAAAYQQVYSWMIGAKMLGPCSMNGGTIYSATYTCDLVRDRGYSARAVWNTVGDTNFVVPSTYTQYRDLGGLVHTVPTSPSITIGKKPILLEHPK